jgi:hypothetical protein
MKFEIQLDEDQTFEKELRRIADNLPPPHAITSHLGKSSISFVWSDLNDEEHGIKFAITIHKTGHIVIGFNNNYNLIISKDFKFNIEAVRELVQYTVSGIFTNYPDSICHFLNNIEMGIDTTQTIN